MQVGYSDFQRGFIGFQTKSAGIGRFYGLVILEVLFHAEPGKIR
jgi:hypothetical protein